MTTTKYDNLLTTGQAAKLLGIHSNTLRAWEKQGRVKAIRLPGSQHRRFMRREIEKVSGLRVESSVINSNSNIPVGVPKIISLFSGCGGMDIGFEKEGYRVVFANDFFEPSALTYRNNIGPIDTRSIYEITPEEVPAGDVLLAGFPCQPFSNAGNRKGVSDPRGTLFFETLRFVDFHEPQVVVFENVRGLLSIVNPDGTKLIDAIEAELVLRDYHVNWKLVNASRFGVPQNRYRVIIVGTKKTWSDNPFVFPLGEEPTERQTLGSVLSNLPTNDPNDEHWALSPQAEALIKHIPEGGSWKNVPYEYLPPRLKRIRDNMKKYRSPNFYRRFSRTEISGTITAAGTPENSGIVHPVKNRRLTVREIARIQSFDDSFIFYGKSVASKYHQIGNAVPPRLAQAIASSLKEQYFD